MGWKERKNSPFSSNDSSQTWGKNYDAWGNELPEIPSAPVDTSYDVAIPPQNANYAPPQNADHAPRRTRPQPTKAKPTHRRKMGRIPATILIVGLALILAAIIGALRDYMAERDGSYTSHDSYSDEPYSEDSYSNEYYADDHGSKDTINLSANETVETSGFALTVKSSAEAVADDFDPPTQLICITFTARSLEDSWQYLSSGDFSLADASGGGLQPVNWTVPDRKYSIETFGRGKEQSANACFAGDTSGIYTAIFRGYDEDFHSQTYTWPVAFTAK